MGILALPQRPLALEELFCESSRALWQIREPFVGPNYFGIEKKLQELIAPCSQSCDRAMITNE